MSNNFFINKLVDLEQRNNRYALAELRRASSDPDSNFLMLKVIGSYLPFNISQRDFNLYKQLACLFSIHKNHTDTEYFNFGSSCKILWKSLDTGKDSFENRFSALLNAHQDDLYRYLLPIIGQLKDIPVNYELLLDDIKRWGHPNKFIQKSWAIKFWGNRKENK